MHHPPKNEKREREKRREKREKRIRKKQCSQRVGRIKILKNVLTSKQGDSATIEALVVADLLLQTEG